MREIELKFQVPAARRAGLVRALRGRGAALPVLRLQAAYFDTSERALAGARMALRLRREGADWVQTLKAAPTDGLTRAEHESRVDGPAGRRAALPPLDPQRHAGTPVGQALLALLATLPPDALQCRFRTDIRRTTRLLRLPGGGLVELAFDEGELIAGSGAEVRRLPVCELEFELKAGTPAQLIALAARWQARHGLVFDTRTKAERGDLLARGRDRATVRGAQPAAIEPGMTLAQARRAALLACLDQVLGNASQVAAGPFDDEHLHQLRVGLRRLRSALRLFAPEGATPDPLADGAAALFRALGAARDVAAVAGPLQAALVQAMRQAGLDTLPPALPLAAVERAPGEVVADPATQAWLLALLAELQAEPAAEAGAPLRRTLVRRLERLRRGLVEPAGRLAALDDAARHALRKRAKRLRYGLEFAAPLFGPKRVRRLLGPLKRLQEAFGALNDSVVALDALRAAPPGDAASAFARGWLVARREAQLAHADAALRTLADAPRAWKKNDTKRGSAGPGDRAAPAPR